ncbi:uncharacterized protein LOC143241630 [Tachypleus tridentatus]|uniref:uncharacterized protein LOC143241630 n=1 Tax=Tachypleus tridentatus TaxID=6853 RepID=UPI003FCFD3AD
MKFAIPRIWHKPTDHSSDYYFCMVDPFKCWASKNAFAIMYLDLPSSIALVPHCPELPITTQPERKLPSSEESSKSEYEVYVEDPDYNFIPDWSPRRLYYVSLLSLPLEQQGHRSTLQQEALVTTDRILCREAQC